MKSRQPYRLRYRPIVTVAAVAGIVLTAAACTSSSTSSTASTSSSPTSSGSTSTAAAAAPVTITVDCAPPASEDPAQHKEWLEDVATFEKANPNITISSVFNYPCESPPTFTAMLRAGTEPNLFQTYFTDLPQVLTAGQAADITSYVNTSTVPNLDSITPGAMNDVKAGSSIYGLPTSNYTQGLIYNRKLFSEAGLNPNDPPTTWTAVEKDATAIAKLGNGIEGWGDYSADNNGGWHFASYMDALGGTTVNATTAPPTAGFDNADGLAILEALHTLRFTDNAMSATQGLGWGALQEQFAQGKLGMYIAAPDDIYNVIVPSDHGTLSDIGMGPLPSITGKPAGSLSGGNDYLFAKTDTPAQIEAGIKWIDFEDLHPRTRPVQLHPAEGGRHPGRLRRARPVQRRRRVADQLAQGRVRDDQHLVLHRVRQRERGQRRRATRRPGRLQVARPDHAGRADRAERQHPGAAQAGGDQRQRRPAVRRGLTAETTVRSISSI